MQAMRRRCLMMPESLTRFSRSRLAASELSNWILSCSNSVTLSAGLHMSHQTVNCLALCFVSKHELCWKILLQETYLSKLSENFLETQQVLLAGTSLAPLIQVPGRMCNMRCRPRHCAHTAHISIVKRQLHQSTGTHAPTMSVA